MRFRFSHEFEAPREVVASVMLSSDYLPFAVEHHSKLLKAELLDRSETATHITRAIRYLPRPVIESIGKKKIPPAWFEFVENSTWDKAKFQLTFENIPTTKTIANALVNKGTLTLHDRGSSRTERITEGELALKLPLLLRPLALLGERLIYSEAEKLLNGEAETFRHWLATSSVT